MTMKLGRWVMMAAVLLACSGSASTDAITAVPVAAAQPPLAANASAEAKMADAYLALQERLAADDAAGAKAAFTKLIQAAGAVTGEPAAKLKTAAERADGSDDIAVQRAAFEHVSEALITIVESTGNPLPYAVRRVKCPMAFDGRGGRWLQRAEKVANPYYGAEMLTCGTIELVIAPGAKR